LVDPPTKACDLNAKRIHFVVDPRIFEFSCPSGTIRLPFPPGATIADARVLVVQKIRSHQADLEFVLDNALIPDSSPLSELPVGLFLVSLMTPVRFVFRGRDYSMLVSRYRQIEEILSLVAEAICADLEVNQVGLLFNGREGDVEMTLADIGEFESIQMAHFKVKVSDSLSGSVSAVLPISREGPKKTAPGSRHQFRIS
jgi:hypothetical protein